MHEYKIYKSLDILPIWNYNMICEKNDVRYLLVLDDYNDLPEKCNIEKCYEIWDKLIYDFDYLDLSLEFAEKQVLIKELEYSLNPENKILKTEIAIKQKEYERLKKLREKNLKKNTQTFNDKIANIEIILGIKIDVYKDSVKRFFAYEKQAISKIEYFEKYNQKYGKQN